ncbi:hypothetical protein CIPAW_04G056400 [Carya illinoinensis]|uniref:Uncharacterized protein n=1 Tax=Carya illinoinensis TaxID=32201 RepID=A0A8T1QRS4_CARIL|nr:hypothetical protein CIPAW_04G056400 [Carya illinoinensis]KAG6656948.1 hypothetical protein CIPAW_04G056400 [Carya illinoinensis]KAG6656949.1 hypothetical protein CIPAW_04G056400 [Carya illinoinensis]
MPGNGVEDRIHKLYGPDNSSLDQHQFQAVEDSWPGFNCNPWVGKWRQIGVAPSCDVKSFNHKKLDSVKRHGGESLSATFNRNREYSNIYSRSQQLSSNEDMHGCHKFQENVSGDSPTLTTNSERSEITEASVDLELVGGKQQLVKGQQLHTPHTHLMQSGYNEMQLLQQHVVFKQLQELQRQQQLQHFGDSRQQNSAMTKQAAGAQISPVINGTPVNDASHMLMNWMQQGPSPTVQGVSSRVEVSQDQGQALHSMGLASQQLDVSLYGTPIASARGGMNEYSHLYGMSHDSTNLLTKVSVQAQKPIMQSSSFSNPLVGDQVTVSSEQVCFPQEGFISKQRLQGNNMFGQIPVQGLNSTVVSSNLQLGSTLQKNASPTEFNGRPERAGWSGTLQQKNIRLGPSQGLFPLDPMEEKILYNLDDNIWDTSFGGHIDMGTGGFGITMDPTDHSSAFPAIQSGSWSALMQSAVAEASSSDTGLQEEWSGLSFQNSELSTDNQPSNAMDSEKQQSSWLDGNLLRTTSLSSRHFPVFNESSVSSSFPGFHQPGVQFSIEQRDTLPQDDSHESIRKSPKNSGEWIDCGHKQKPSIEGRRPVQPLVSLDSAWSGQIFEHPESNSHQQRMASINNFSQPCSELKGDINEATYQGRSFDDCLRESNNNSVASYFSRPARGLEPVHSGMDGTLRSRENSQIFNFAAVPNSSPSKAFQETGQHNQADYVKSADISRNKENQSMDKNQHQMSNGSYGLHNYLEKGGGTDGMLQKCYQNDNSYDDYGLKGFSGQEQEHGHLTDYQGNSKVSEIASRGDFDPSMTFRRSVHPHFEKVTAPSENMLELLHKVDQSEENSSIPHFGSRACDSLVSETETSDRSVAHLYNQSAACQGFAMKLAPASQQLSNMNPFISSQDMPEVECNLGFRQANSEIEKSQTWLAYPSVQSCSSLHESSQRSHWDNKLRISGQTSIPSSLYMPGVAAFTSSPPYIRNQLQMQDMPNAPLACSSSQSTLAGTVSRYPSFDLAPSQRPVMSGMHQQGSFSERLHNIWTNVPVQQRPSVVESLKVPAIDPSTNCWETSLVSLGINDQNPEKVGYGSSEFGTSPRNSQGFEHGASQQEGGRSQMLKSSEIHDASQTHSLPRNISDADAFASGSLLAHSHQLDLDRIQHEDNNVPSPSERIIGTIGHSLKLSHVSHPNYSLLPQVQVMKNVDTDPSRRVSDVEHVAATDAPQLTYEENSKFRNQLDTGLMSASPSNTSPSGDTKMQSFLTEGRENFGIKASSQPALLDRPQVMVTTGQNDFLSQSITSNVVSNQAGHPQINLCMSPSLFKQYEAFRHVQMPLLYDGRHVKTAAGQFSLWKPSQNLDIVSSGGRIDAADASESLSAPYLLPSDGTNQCMANVRPKKRKAATSGLLPWCKEVTQGSQRVQNISVAEHDWAKATNRLIEKVEDEAELVEDRLSMFQSKKRLIMTSQLMQQLFCPAPMSILSARAVSQYDTLAYSVAKLSLGDACSLTSCTINRFLDVPLNNNTLISEQLKAFEPVDDQSFSEVVKDFSNRAKKLEIGLLRLDKAASILDVRVECQEMEKFSVINRFAKFHIRQADSSGNSSSSSTVTPAPKPNPQRYVIAHPIPRNLPEGLQCLSL